MGEQVKVKALKDFKFASQNKKQGDVFEVTRKQFLVLKAVKFAALDTDNDTQEVVVSPLVYNRRDMQAESLTVKPVKPVKVTKVKEEKATEKKEKTKKAAKKASAKKAK